MGVEALEIFRDGAELGFDGLVVWGVGLGYVGWEGLREGSDAGRL